MNIPGREEYLSLSQKHNLIPVYCEIDCDLDTPISIFIKVVSKAPAYLLESVAGGENLGRYSFIGIDPFIILASWGNKSLVTTGGQPKTFFGSPLEILERLVSGFKVHPEPRLPCFFGGAAGCIGYNTIRFIEERVELKQSVPTGLPDCNFIFAGTVLIFDHVRRSLTIVINSHPGNEPQQAYDAAVLRIEDIIQKLKFKINTGEKSQKYISAGGPVEANLTKAEFMEKVNRAKEYIRAGDILQVVLSRRLQLPFRGDSFNVYRRLRALNPSPYLFYFDFGELKIVGSSPEMLVRVEGKMIETCPIAGTRPRGADPAADEIFASGLLEDAKERAEHLMLVDLGRNDLGKVCATGSISLAEFMEIEKYSHVMHLVSRVRGRIAPGKNCFDAFKACFPAGTVTGAPKVRAMEIISELEPDGRGIYAGAIGYFGFTRRMDTAITIRTVVIHKGKAYIQAGAGIVADSDPGREYEETLTKAQALLKTLGASVR